MLGFLVTYASYIIDNQVFVKLITCYRLFINHILYLCGLMKNPVFSIITVVFNGEHLLEGTIQSVTAQTYPHIEYIVVDGGSKDGTVAIIKRYEAAISAWKSERDAGIYDGMNKALHMATGDFVLFLNCGDHLFAPDTLAKVASKIQADTDIIYGNTMMEDDDRRELGLMSEVTSRGYPKNLTWRSMRFGMNICHQSFFVRRNIAGDYIMDFAADIDWCIRALKVARGIVDSGVVVSRYLTGGISMQQKKKSLEGRYHVLRRHFGWLPNIIAHGFIVIRGVIFKWQRRGKVTY